MTYRIALTSSDGKVINQHFGHCSEFSILEVESDTGEWKFVEKRQIAPACNGFSHNEEHIQKIAKLISDCTYLLTLRIGNYPHMVLQRHGITCLELPEVVPEALQKLNRYHLMCCADYR